MTSSAFKVFENFDNKDVYLRLKSAAISDDSRNFVIEFDERFARCAFNVDQHNIFHLLDDRTAKVKVI